jgi:dUTP pyrophosphatase
VKFKPHFKKTGGAVYEIGDRGAQLIIIPHPIVEWNEVNELNNTERGEGGFGSTGK